MLEHPNRPFFQGLRKQSVIGVRESISRNVPSIIPLPDEIQVHPAELVLDGDGDRDLYVVSGSVEWDVDSRQLQDRLYLNDGQGRFAMADSGWLPPVKESGSCVAAADFAL